jgi:hypothetical protein
MIPDPAGHELIAPELDIVEWRNTDAPISLAGLRGRVVMLHAFQMLCPGCVMHGTPLAQRIFERYSGPDLAVIGLHTVFEHHSVMTADALDTFLHEFRVTMPIGIDRPGTDADGIPNTMRAYSLRGTPSIVLIDRTGRIRWNGFGGVEEVGLGLQIGRLMAE